MILKNDFLINIEEIKMIETRSSFSVLVIGI